MRTGPAVQSDDKDKNEGRQICCRRLAITLTTTDGAGNAAYPMTVTEGSADTQGSGCGPVIGGSAGLAIDMTFINVAALAFVWKRRNKN